MSAIFEEFKASFDSYLDRFKEPPGQMLFLRYDGPLQFPEGNENLSWEQYVAVLDDCQNYAISREVTSTYVFFNPGKFEEWRGLMEQSDSVQARAEWAAKTQIKEAVVTHAANPITYFIIVGHPDWYKVLPEQL